MGIKIPLGISACLLGENVRYDGNHRRNNYVVETLGSQFELIPVCPESELGMGVPRETVDLEGDPHNPRMIGTHSRKNWTTGMNQWADNRVQQLSRLNLCGFVLKKGSPSCGVRNVPIIQRDNNQVSDPLLGQGLFVIAIQKAEPNFPIEDELRLEEEQHRKEFIKKVLARGQSLGF
ncbi:MAG: DUF523 domain-containing protein [bacterium]|nr:DUF523 domain-containing protein [bacterium]